MWRSSKWKLAMHIKPRMRYKGKLIRGMHRWTQKTKPFIYGIVFRDNTTFRKQNTLLQVKLKALSMEEKDVDLWWDLI
jgi:hypothetical protein